MKRGEVGVEVGLVDPNETFKFNRGVATTDSVVVRNTTTKLIS
jgi:hypothetical protein